MVSTVLFPCSGDFGDVRGRATQVGGQWVGLRISECVVVARGVSGYSTIQSLVVAIVTTICQEQRYLRSSLPGQSSQ